MTLRTDLHAQSATQIYLEQASREFAGDARTQVAAAMIEYANEARHSTRQERLYEEQYQSALEVDQVQAMRREADQIRAAGTARGVFGIVGGGLQAAGGAAQISGANAASSGPSVPGAAPAASSSGAWGTVLQGGGQISASVGELLGAHHDGRAADARANQTALTHRIDGSERRLQALSEDSNEALELQRGAIEHLRGVSESEANGAQTVIFRG